MQFNYKKTIVLASSFLLFSSLYAQDNNPLVDSKIVIEEGIELHDQEKYNEAIQKYMLVSKSDTNYMTALYEACLSYSGMKNYTKAIELGKEGLKVNSSSKLSFYNTVAGAYDDSGDSLKALEVYKEGLSEFPHNYLLHYNLGITYEKLKKYDEAMGAYQKAINLNLYHAGSHLRLGILMANQGNLVPALLSLNTFLTLEGNTDRAYAALMIIQDLVQAKYEPKTVVSTSYTGDIFKEIDVLINSKISLNDKYKSKIKLRYPTTLQSQLLLEKLEYVAKENDFWMQTYVPFFKSVYNENQFEPFAYNLLTSVNIEDAQKWLKKNSTKLKDFGTWAVSVLNKQRSNATVVENGVEKPVYRTFYDKGELYGIGESKEFNNSKVPVGLWTYYFSSGYKMSLINYNNEGKKEGKTIYYHSNGEVNTICNYKNGELEGKYELFNERGVLVNVVNYKEGKLDGNFIENYGTGQLHFERVYKDGKKHGPETEYFIDGSVKLKGNYLEGEIEGDATVYFNSGAIDWKGSYKTSKRNGQYISYYRNGKIESKGEYLNGEYVGKWELYHRNGKLKQILNYNNLGKIVGEVKVYNDQGALEEVMNFNEKGEKQGQEKLYNVKTGKVFSVSMYESDKLKSTQYLDANGKVIEEYKMSKNKANFFVKNEDGVKLAEGNVANFERNGPWKFYNKFGKLINLETYKDGVLDGPWVSYYVTGIKASEVDYKDGSEHGYFKSYYNNGKLKSEGWYQHGQQQGTWIYYYPTGLIQEKSYFINGILTGINEEYNVLGKKSYESKSWGEIIEEINFLDSTGKVVSNNVFVKGNGEEKSFYPNKKIRKQAIYKNSLVEGEVLWNFPTGKIYSKANYKAGRRNGKFIINYDNGFKSEEGSYVRGDAVGEWKYYSRETGNLYHLTYYNEFGETDSTSIWYYPSGKVEAKIKFEADQKHGPSIYYSEQGDIVVEKIFEKGELVSFAYYKSDGKKVEEKISKGEYKLKSYYANGKLSAEEDLVDGNYSGKRIQYYPNGSLQIVRNYNNNIQEGEELNYYSNGKVKSSEIYFNGELHGPAKYYRQDGKLEREENYILGEKHGEFKYYDLTGKLIKTVKYVLNIAE
ncbi:MAG: hypothetical protein RLZZ175_468 [Bacteroidota bacterium]|jgi:antitoxin component YwqK of YwqJK toxin-antitoxin module